MTSVLPDRASTSAGSRIFSEVGPDFTAHFREHGFAILGDALSPAEVAAVNDEALGLCRGDYGAIGYGNWDDHVAPDVSGMTDEQVLRAYLCIHHPHKLAQASRNAMTNPRIVDTLTSVIGPNVKSMQSMLFIKSEGKPGQAWHQDEYFIPTRDRSLTAVWIALDDATIENGCLWVIPGSQRRGVLYPQREQRDPRFDCTTESYDFPYSDDDAVPVEIPAGTALVFNGYLLHRSLQNSGAHGYRRALALHYMSAESLLPWKAPTGEDHMGMVDFRDIVMVAGTDPYAFKGTPDINRPYSRADLDGGCDR